MLRLDKVCTCCGLEKPKENFAACKKHLDGLRYYCRDCDRQKSAEYYSKNAERLRVEGRARAKLYREADREKHVKQRSDWAKANRSLVASRRRQYRANNIEERRRKESEYMRRREAVDIKFKLSYRISALMRDSLGRRATNRECVPKRGKWESIVGYTATELKAHIERQFSAGMTWDNYGRGIGKWQIDHIIPVSKFSYNCQSDEEFLACWAMHNLRPLWATENRAKADQRTILI